MLTLPAIPRSIHIRIPRHPIIQSSSLSILLCLAPPQFPNPLPFKLHSVPHQTCNSKPHSTSIQMGKKKGKGEYNDFLDGEKLRDNTEIRTTLQGSSTTITSSAATRDISPPPTRQDRKGKKKKGGPKKLPLTHFLCFPVVNDGSRAQLESALKVFGDDVERKGLVPLKAIRPVGTLHLTLGVMSLDEKGLDSAGRYLEDLDLRGVLRDAMAAKRENASEEGGVALEPAISTDATRLGQSRDGPLSIDLKGLLPMQQAHKTSVLYAEPLDSSSRLYPFALALRDLFTDKGFLVKFKRALILHATVVNTVYAKPEGRRGRGRKGKHPKAAATEEPEILEDHEDDRASITGSTGVEIEDSTFPDPSAVETEAQEVTEKVDRSEGHGPNAMSWMHFDATETIEQYRDFVWANHVKVDRVQICKMGAKKILDDTGEVVDEKYEVVFEKEI